VIPFQNVCLQIQRLENVSPFGVLHSKLKETTLLAYRIPKRYHIVTIFLVSYTDQEIWNGQSKIDPDAFLDADEKLFEAANSMLFSISINNQYFFYV
jgi:hypothetical protein